MLVASIHIRNEDKDEIDAHARNPPVPGSWELSEIFTQESDGGEVGVRRLEGQVGDYLEMVDLFVEASYPSCGENCDPRDQLLIAQR